MKILYKNIGIGILFLYIATIILRINMLFVIFSSVILFFGLCIFISGFIDGNCENIHDIP